MRHAGARTPPTLASATRAHAGNEAGTEEYLRRGVEELRALGILSFFSTVAARLAQSLYAQGRLDEARELTRVARETSPQGDLINFILADVIDGCVLAHEGRHDAARPLLRRAVDDVEKTDFFWARADVHLMYAEALALAGEGAAAARAAAFGLELLEAKGDITGAGRARERLDTVGLAPA